MAGINQTLITVPEMSSFEDVRQALAKALGDLQLSIVSQLPVTNYQSKRITNVGAPQAADDVVTLKYLQSGGSQNTQAISVVNPTANTGPGGGNGGLLVATEIPAGTINGTNTVFTVTKPIVYQPKPILSLNGAVQDPLNVGVDFITSGTNITYALPPIVGDRHVIWYWYSNTGQANAGRVGRFYSGGTDSLDWGGSSTFNILGDMAIGMWAKLPSNAGFYLIFRGSGIGGLGAAPGNNEAYRIAIAGSSNSWNIIVSWEFGSTPTQISMTFTTAIPNDVWKYIGFSRDSVAKTVTLYVGDGAGLTTIGTQSYSNNPDGGAGTCSLVVGNQFPHNLNTNIASIQEHYIWTRVLSYAEHLSAMQGSPSSTNLVLSCPVLGNNPEVDTSVTGATGAVVGTTIIPGHA